MGCDEVLVLLREREAACGGEVERLRGEAERIAGLLRVCEEELARVSTAVQVVGELPAVQASAVSARLQVPAPRGELAGGQAAEVAVSFTERVLGVLAGYAGPVRCRQVVEGLGLEATARTGLSPSSNVLVGGAGVACGRGAHAGRGRLPAVLIV